MRKHVASQIGDDSLPERVDEVDAGRTGKGEHRHDCDHQTEITVDQADAVGGEAEIDHASHRNRHDKGGQRRNGERD
jgi:hypothetical protein